MLSQSQVQDALRVIAHALPQGASVTIEKDDLVEYRPAIGSHPILLRTQDLAEKLFPSFLVRWLTEPGYPIVQVRQFDGGWWLYRLDTSEGWIALRAVRDDCEFRALQAAAMSDKDAAPFLAIVQRLRDRETN